MISARTLPTTTLQPRTSLPPHHRVGGPADFDALVVSGAHWVLLGCAAWAALIAVAAGVELVSGGRTRALTWVAAPPWVRRSVLSLLGATLVGVPTTAGLATAAPVGPVGTTAGGSVGTVLVPGAATVSRPGSDGSHVRAGSTGPDGWDGAAGPDGLPVPSRPAIEAPPVPDPTSSAAPSTPPTRPGPSTPPSTTPSTTPLIGAPGSAPPGSAGGGGPGGPADPTATSQAPPTGTAGGAPGAGPTHVVVRAGDCLWDIASRRLPPGASRAEVAEAVARLHALNHRLIGPDPDLLRPGQRLAVPPRL